MIRPGGFISLPFVAPLLRAVGGGEEGGGGGGAGVRAFSWTRTLCDPKNILEILLSDERVVFAVFTSPPPPLTRCCLSGFAPCACVG